jgi:hypothetical protein
VTASLFRSKTVGARMYAMGEIEERGKRVEKGKAWERLRKGRHGRD